MLQVVGEASPKQFALSFSQAAHVELPEPQFALDPGVAKFDDPSSATILRSSFFAGHLLPERHDLRAFLSSRHRTTSLLIAGTALHLTNALLAVLPVGRVTVQQ